MFVLQQKNEATLVSPIAKYCLAQYPKKKVECPYICRTFSEHMRGKTSLPTILDPLTIIVECSVTEIKILRSDC